MFFNFILLFMGVKKLPYGVKQDAVSKANETGVKLLKQPFVIL